LRNHRRSEVDNKSANIKTNINMGMNPFAPLFDITKCFYCHNFGHKSYECQLKNSSSQSQNNCRIEKRKQWRKKKEAKKVDKCGLVLYAQNHNSQWYVDTSYSRHMRMDKSKFESQDESF